MVCLDCGEPVDDLRHPECCDHDHVDKDDDGRDRRFFVCTDCGSEVFPTRDEGGETFWEAA